MLSENRSVGWLASGACRRPVRNQMLAVIELVFCSRTIYRGKGVHNGSVGRDSCKRRCGVGFRRTSMLGLGRDRCGKRHSRNAVGG